MAEVKSIQDARDLIRERMPKIGTRLTEFGEGRGPIGDHDLWLVTAYLGNALIDPPRGVDRLGWANDVYEFLQDECHRRGTETRVHRARRA